MHQPRLTSESKPQGASRIGINPDAVAQISSFYKGVVSITRLDGGSVMVLGDYDGVKRRLTNAVNAV